MISLMLNCKIEQNQAYFAENITITPIYPVDTKEQVSQ